MGFYVYFNAPTWCFKTGFGSRIIPTRRSVEAVPASDRAPIGPVLPSALHDADGEAVRKKAQEELREETELKSMEKQDHPAPAPQPILASSSAARRCDRWIEQLLIEQLPLESLDPLEPLESIGSYRIHGFGPKLRGFTATNIAGWCIWETRFALCEN